jgi:hypothetical protein
MQSVSAATYQSSESAPPFTFSEYYSFKTSSVVTQRRAPVGQVAVHIGCSRSFSRSWHMSHFCILPSRSNSGIWKGHASEQARQPLHRTGGGTGSVSAMMASQGNEPAFDIRELA